MEWVPASEHLLLHQRPLFPVPSDVSRHLYFGVHVFWHLLLVPLAWLCEPLPDSKKCDWVCDFELNDSRADLFADDYHRVHLHLLNVFLHLGQLLWLRCECLRLRHCGREQLSHNVLVFCQPTQQWIEERWRHWWQHQGHSLPGFDRALCR